MKPGDKVLVEARRLEVPGKAFDVVEWGGTSVLIDRDRVFDHPGCDPALLPELVAAVREETEAEDEWRAMCIAAGGERSPRYVSETKRYKAAKQRRRDLAARMEADDEK